MKKLIVIGAITFLVSIGAAVGARILLFAPKGTEPLAADSTGVVVEHDPAMESAPPPAEQETAEQPSPLPPARELPGGTAAPEAIASNEPAEKPAASKQTTEVDPAPVTQPEAEPLPVPQDARPTETTEETRPDGSQYKMLAKIIATMKTSDAVKILAYLDDDQVEGILRSMQVRQIATLLAKLPTERAAVLGQRLVDKSQGDEG